MKNWLSGWVKKVQTTSLLTLTLSTRMSWDLAHTQKLSPRLKKLSGEKLFCRILLLLPVLLQTYYSWRSSHCLSPNSKPNFHCTFNHKSKMCWALRHSLGPQAMVEMKRLLQKKSCCSLPVPSVAPMQPHSTQFFDPRFDSLPTLCLIIMLILIVVTD